MDFLLPFEGDVPKKRNDDVDWMIELMDPPAPPAAKMDDEADVLFVALGKYYDENESVLLYAVERCRARRSMDICILHVHQPLHKRAISGRVQEVDVHNETERKAMHNILNRYIRTCERARVKSKKLFIEMDCVEKGIVQLISQHGINRLVMGAASRISYSGKMMKPMSKKAIYVCQQAPTFCQIYFVCGGNLVHTRESRFAIDNNEDHDDPFSLSSSSTETAQSSSLVTLENVNDIDLSSRSPSVLGSSFSTMISSGKTKDSNFPKAQGSETRFESHSPTIDQADSHYPALSTANIDGDVNKELYAKLRKYMVEAQSSQRALFEESIKRQKAEKEAIDAVLGVKVYLIKEGGMKDELYAKLKQYMTEAESFHKALLEESIKRQTAEKEAMDVLLRAKAFETIYHSDRVKYKKEMEQHSLVGTDEVDKVKSEQDEIIAKLEIKIMSLESQIADYDSVVKALENELSSALNTMQRCRKERDELQVEHKNALIFVDELMKQQSEEASSSSISQYFQEFSKSDIEVATRNFDPSLMMCEESYGSIYKGKLRHTQVAVKLLDPNSWQGAFKFHQEVNILSKLRHPNIISLIGSNPETLALIYEYLPNGNLEDCLNCKDNAPPLPWQTRMRIATELCSALIFLHSCLPSGVIHGDLKPANILLDATFVSKLSNFGVCHVFSRDESTDDDLMMSAYIDPNFLASGELTTKSDVYSFGIVLLRLLTGMPAFQIATEVQCVLDEGNLKDILDPTAGDWPFVQAQQLTLLALNCTDANNLDRPDLSSVVWRILEPMSASCGSASSRLGSEEHRQIPHYFVCPISQEAMKEPVVSADGFTYEAEALKGWFERGHDTSPMTNLRLANLDVLPNHSLRSAIQEWLQRHET